MRSRPPWVSEVANADLQLLYISRTTPGLPVFTIALRRLERKHMKRLRSPIACAFAWLVLIGPASSQTPTLFGTLSNFDVFNDTGQETHGFEIELDCITGIDFSITFGSPYQARYGTPVLVDFPGGVFVRYESPYDPARQIFAGTTPIPPAITPTAGHSCWTGGARRDI